MVLEPSSVVPFFKSGLDGLIMKVDKAGDSDKTTNLIMLKR